MVLIAPPVAISSGGRGEGFTDWQPINTNKNGFCMDFIGISLVIIFINL